MNNELKQKVSAIVRDDLTERFKDEFTFDPIAVVEDIDEFIDDEQEYIEIFIIFDGDQERLDSGWTSDSSGASVQSLSKQVCHTSQSPHSLRNRSG